MRASWKVLAALIPMWAISWGDAFAQPGSPRKAQVIPMGEVARAQVPQTVAPPSAPETAPTAKQALLAAFRVHDLSRRWVNQEMAVNFQQGGEPVATVPDPAGLSGSDSGPGAVEIAVPLWMRGSGAIDRAATHYTPGCGVGLYRPTGFLRADAEYRRARYFGAMSAIACEYGIPVGLFDAMIIQESRYQPDIYSPKNAFGLTQLMSGTAAALAVDRYQIEGNLRGGAKYLRQQLDRFGQYHLALAAYNAGPGRVRNGVVPRIQETLDYVDNVLLNWSRLSGFQRRVATVPIAPAFPSPAAPSAGRSATVSTF